MRIDKWLWFTRFFKTRALAAKSVSGGHVEINGSRAKTSSQVSPGDRINLKRAQLTYRLTVSKLPERRGPASEARDCYAEDEQSVATRKQKVSEIRADRRLMPRTPGKPDKHTRRKLREKSRSTD